MDNKVEHLEVAVVGAGLTGLTVAHHLEKKGVRFKVFEKLDVPGGVIKSVKRNGFLYEEGPNTGVVGTPEVADLFEDLKDQCELELAGEEVKKRYILKDAGWEPLPMGLKSAISTPLFTFRDKIRILAEPFRSKGKDPHETLANMVKRRMGQSFLDYAIDPFILGVYSGDPMQLVPKYALPKLYNLEQTYGSFIGGSIRKKFEKKDPGAEKASRKVFSARGGLSSLTDALFRSAGEQNFVFNAGTVEIRPRWEEYLVSISSGGTTREYLAGQVITTTGAFALPRVLPFISKDQMDKLNSLYYARVVEVTLGFEEWTGIPLDGFGGLIPHKEKREILGALFLSTLLKDRAPEKGALLTLFMGGVRRDELVDLSDEQIKETVEKEMMELFELDAFNPSLFEISRHSKAIPQYGADSGIRFETISGIESAYPGLHLGGNMVGGIGMADRIKQGKTLARKITG